VALAESAAKGETVFRSKKKQPAAREIAALVAEILKEHTP
jgi:hypothetical protein